MAIGYGVADPNGAESANLKRRIQDLYVDKGFSTYAIGRALGMDRQRVARVLRLGGIALSPRGAGRPRGPTQALFSATARELLTDLYIRERRSTAEIGNLFHTWKHGAVAFAEQGIRVARRGANREDRKTPRIDHIEKLYLQGELSAAEVARKVGCSSRIVLRLIHDMGWPVRVGGRALRHGPEDIELICALYSDTLVAAVLLHHGIPEVRTGRTDLATVPITIDSHASDGSRVVRHLWSLNSPDRVVDRPAVRHRRVAASTHRRSARARKDGRSPFLKRWRAEVAGEEQRSAKGTTGVVGAHSAGRRRVT